MLILPDDRAGEAVEVGSTCRICPAAACPARREPTFLSGL
jgi:predicted transcriptional regulator